jgi:glutamine amidotransferase-like uncharacterized protein
LALLFCACPIPHENGKTAIPLTSSLVPPVLLFNGKGTSPNDVDAIEAVLNTRHIQYSNADASQLKEMAPSKLSGYRLLIIPGGNFITIGENLNPETSGHIREAIKGGLNYLGICAGGFFAGYYFHRGEYHGLNLASDARFKFFSNEDRGIRKAAVAIACAGMPAFDQYWEDGPQFTGWGEVVCKYPDGTPAIVEGEFGKGIVLLSGIHAEAPASWWRGPNFAMAVKADTGYAGTLINAALYRIPLPHY